MVVLPSQIKRYSFMGVHLEYFRPSVSVDALSFSEKDLEPLDTKRGGKHTEGIFTEPKK